MPQVRSRNTKPDSWASLTDALKRVGEVLPPAGRDWKTREDLRDYWKAGEEKFYRQVKLLLEQKKLVVFKGRRMSAKGLRKTVWFAPA